MPRIDILKVHSIQSWLKQYDYDLEAAFNAYFKDQLENPLFAGRDAYIDTDFEQFVAVALAWKPHKIKWPLSYQKPTANTLAVAEDVKQLINHNGD